MKHQLRDRFGSLVARNGRLWRRAVDRQLQPFGLTEAMWLPLIHLARATSPMRQKDLAAALTLDGSSVVRLLDALQAADLIERREDGADRRVRTIVLTDAGWGIIERVEAASRKVRDAALSGVADKELAAASGVLDRVAQNLLRLQEE